MLEKKGPILEKFMVVTGRSEKCLIDIDAKGNPFDVKSTQIFFKTLFKVIF